MFLRFSCFLHFRLFFVCDITCETNKMQTHLAPQNDHLNLSCGNTKRVVSKKKWLEIFVKKCCNSFGTPLLSDEYHCVLSLFYFEGDGEMDAASSLLVWQPTQCTKLVPIRLNFKFSQKVLLQETGEDFLYYSAFYDFWL